MNSPEAFADEAVEGILAAHSDSLRSAGAANRALVRADAPNPGKVGIVTGGGSGHLPVFLGYVGSGLATAVAIGNVFSAQSSDAALAAIEAADAGAGVLCLYGNYTGDRLNFELACDLAQANGIRTTSVRVADDVASAPADRANERRGVAGLFFAYKCVGAAAERGDDLDKVTAVAQRVVESVRSMGVGLAPSVLPTSGKPTFSLGENEMEIGIGIHGEPGPRRGQLRSADEVADQLLDAVLPELEISAGSRIAVLVNGLGATPPEELYIVYRRLHQRLDKMDVTVHRAYVGEYATSLEMAGLSVSVLRLDEELTQLLDAPAHSPFFSQRDLR